MRFKWRSHLAVTALAAFSLMPFAGCSSQQQQQGEEVEASEQGEEGQGEEGDVNANAQTNSEEETGNQLATNAEGQSGNEQMNAGEEVVTNDTSGMNGANGSPAADGDLQEIISEMGNGSTPVNNAAPVPMDAAPMTEQVAEAPPANAAPAATNTAPAATDTAPVAAAGPAAVSGLPEIGSKMPYVVEAGDTLGKVASRIYGDQKKWRDISNLTGLSNPNHIFPGDVVYYSLDEASAQFAATYASLQRSQETVRDGDTLASIAMRVYGSSRSWRHIWRQNDNIDNPDKLTSGMTIYYINKDVIRSAFNDLLNKSTANKLTTVLTKNLKKTGNIMTYHQSKTSTAKRASV